MIHCPNMSHPSIPFVLPKDDVVSIWTMSHRLASLSIQLVVSSFFRNEFILIILVLSIFVSL